MTDSLPSLPSDPTAILYLALRSSRGVLVRFNNSFESARNILYSARKASCDPDLYQLGVREGVEKGTLIVMRVGGAVAGAGEGEGYGHS